MDCNIDYKYFAGTNNPIEIILKYLQRGYGTILNSNEIKLIIERNKDLAKRLNINGTPSFVIGKKIIPGAVNEEQLIKLIEEERKSNS